MNSRVERDKTGKPSRVVSTAPGAVVVFRVLGDGLHVGEATSYYFTGQPTGRAAAPNDAPKINGRIAARPGRKSG